MKRIRLLLLIVVSLCVSELSYAQKISINLKSVPLAEVFEAISSQTGYTFNYSLQVVDPKTIVSIDAESLELDQVIAKLFPKDNVGCSVDGKRVFLTNKTPKAKAQPKPQAKVAPAPKVAKNALHGEIVDSNGAPIIGATIFVQNSNNGTTSDLDGKFKLSNISKDAVLEVDYIGYQRQIVEVNNRSEIVVVLKDNVQILDEVVVIGYGVQRKETLTGSIASVGTDDLVNSANSSVSNALQGKMPGLIAVASTGQPGVDDADIYIRGLGSLSEESSSPLILIDGVEGTFSQMDPNEIESISILKDASATAVFGVRGANGVILVTTRRGEKGKARISVSSSLGIDSPTRILEMADSYTFATKRNEMAANDGTPQVFNDYAIERFRLKDDPLMYPDINWRDVLLKSSTIKTQHNVNVSGGTEDVRYFVSVGYLYQDGIVDSIDAKEKGSPYTYDRYNYRSNFDVNVTPTTVLKLGIGGTTANTKAPSVNYWEYFRQTAPMVVAGINDKGQVIKVPDSRYSEILIGNDVVTKTYQAGTSNRMNSNMKLDVTIQQKLDFITKGLSVEVKGAYNTNYGLTKTLGGGQPDIIVPYYTSELDGLLNGVVSTGDLAFDPDSDFGDDYNKDIVYKKTKTYKSTGFSQGMSRSRDWYMEGSIRYNRKFEDHNFGGLLLYNQSKKYYMGGDYNAIPRAYVGFVGRMTYDYKSKYMAEINAGYNGSENFAPGRRYGFFPSASVGYTISEESFMKNQDVIDYLKLRASIGLVGNDYLGSTNRFLYLSSGYNVDSQSNDGTFGGIANGYNFGTSKLVSKASYETKLANEDVTWETALKQNYGFDMYVLKERLKVSFDYFHEYREDILIERKVIPIFSGFTTNLMAAANLGIVENKGYEVELKWSDKVRDFRYDIGASLSYAHNTIIEMDEIPPAEEYQRKTGRSVGSVFGYKCVGLYGYEDFVLDGSGDLLLSDAGLPQLKEGLPVPYATVYPGDAKFINENNDDVIDTKDQTYIGMPKRPEYTMGLNMNFYYKNLSFGMNWTAVTNTNILLEGSYTAPFDQSGYRTLYQYHADNCWTPETANTATMPRMSLYSYDLNTSRSSLWLRDGSYLRLKNVTLGYRIANKKILNALGAKSINVNVSGYNLLTFDHLDGIIDPEGSPNNSELYPIMKTINFGVNLTF